MAKEVITTLHPEDDITTDLYPNIKEDNIPSTFKEKVASEIANRTELIHKDATSSNTIVVGESDYALELVGTQVNARSGIYCDYINTITKGNDLYINNQGYGNIYLSGDTYVSELKGGTLTFDYTLIDFEQITNVYFGTNVNIEELKTDNINNTNGNAMLRYKSTENKVVLGGSTIPTTIMGSGERPTYSNNGSDFTGKELALKSDVESNWSSLMANLGIGRWENATFTDWQAITTDVDPLCTLYTNHRRCFYHRIWKSQDTTAVRSNITINGCDMVMGDRDHSYFNCYAGYTEGSEITLMLGNMSGAMSYCFSNSPAYIKIDIQEGKTAKNVGYTQGIFWGCTNLEYIGAIDFSDADQINGGNAYMFRSCSKLKTIKITHWHGDFDISSSTAFEEADLVEIISNLDTVSTTQTLTMGATNLAKLTDEEKKVATDKGWVLA